MTPLVSVIMTVRNGGRYLQETLDAVGRQTFEDFEFVINDNGSTDGTSDILRRYAERDARVRLIDAPWGDNNTFTQGIARALLAAQAPLVAVNDGDDVPTPYRLEKQVAVLRARPEVTLVASWYDEIDTESRMIATYCLPGNHSELVDAYQCGNPVAHSSIMYRREAALAAGGYRSELTYASDFALQIALVAAGGHVVIIPESLVKIRVHDEQTSLMPSRRAERYREPLEVLDAAGRLDGVTCLARLKGMFSRQKLALRYGMELWKSGRHVQSFLETSYWIFLALWSPVYAAIARLVRKAETAAGAPR